MTKLLRYRGALYRLAANPWRNKRSDMRDAKVAKAIHDITSEYLKSMGDSDWVRVFHATGIDSHNKLGPQSMVFGIDATGQARSHYHPNTPGFYRYQGLYVGPTMDSVSQFGRLVFEFVVRAKNLHATDWSGRIPRRYPEEFDPDLPKCEESYPGSDDPLLSCSLDPKGRAPFRGLEPQALLIGIVPAEDVLAVHYFGKHTPDEFIEKYQKDLPGYRLTKRDPKSTRLSLQDYIGLMSEAHGYSTEKLIPGLRRIIERGGDDMERAMKRMLPFSGPSLRKFVKEFKREYME